MKNKAVRPPERSAQAGQYPPGNGWQNATGNHPFGRNGRGPFAGALPTPTRRGAGADECRTQRGGKSRLRPHCCARSICAGWWSVAMPCLIAAPSARRSCKRMAITSGRSKKMKRASIKILKSSSSPIASGLGRRLRRRISVAAGRSRRVMGASKSASIIVSSLLADYSDWPEMAQVFKLERQSTNALGITRTQVRYGVTSLPAHVADPKRLLELRRGHWGIENGLHYRRDVTLHEDHAQLRMGHAPEMLAVLNNIVLGCGAFVRWLRLIDGACHCF